MTTREPLRLLMLAPFAPRLDAPHGGGRAIAGLVSELGSRHSVALLCVRAEGDPPTDAHVREHCVLVEEFIQPGEGSTPTERWRRRVRLLAGLAQGRPMWAADCRIRSLAARVEVVQRTWQPDLIQAEFHVMGQYLRLARSSGVARVLTEIEPGTPAAQEAWLGSRGPARALLRADAVAWRRFEKRVIGDADCVVAYTERDCHAVSSLAPNARVVRIPLGTRLPSQPLDPVGEKPASVVFVGNFIHPPNVDAALRLVRDIFPRVVSSEPEVQLYIVGDRVPDVLRRDAGRNVVLTGLVDDVTPFLARAAVVVAPLRRGGGQRVKVGEALAAGKALVASRLAVEGLGVSDGQEVLLAESDAEFSDAVLRLLTDEGYRAALAARARSWAEANLGWGPTVEGYERLYDELLGRSRRPAR